MIKPRAQPLSAANSDRQWLAELSPPDRTAALRLIYEPGGDARLRRIAAALSKRGKGRPRSTSERQADLRSIAILYVTTDGITVTAAAGRVFDTLSPRPEMITRRGYTNQMKASFDLLDQGYLAGIAADAARDGHPVRFDLFPDIAKEAARQLRIKACAEELAALHRERIGRLRGYSATVARRLPKAPVYDLDRATRVNAFCDAFPDTIRPDILAHDVDAFFDWVAKLAAEHFAPDLEHE